MYKTAVKKNDFHSVTQQFFKNKTVAVTGGTGFIGSHLVEQLLQLEANPIVISRNENPHFLSSILNRIELRQCDLMNFNATVEAFKNSDVVINLAATIGGLAFNKKHPASIYHQNTQLFLNTIEAARLANIDYFTTCSSACVYPRFCSLPTPECEGVKDEPEPTNSGYGWAKRMQEYLSIKYVEEFGMKIAIPRPYNGYGPRDNFNSDTSHVIPSLIKKAFDSNSGYFDVWGNGDHTRSFLYVDDFARGILEITARYACHDPINIGADEEITIKTLAHLIANEVSAIRQQEIHPRFNESGLTGQPRRKCDTTKIVREIAFETQINLIAGLRKTIQWYNEFGRENENRINHFNAQRV